MTEKETKNKLEEQGYTGKLNQMYDDDDGHTYFDVTPKFLKKLFGGRKVKTTEVKDDPKA